MLQLVANELHKLLVAKNKFSDQYTSIFTELTLSDIIDTPERDINNVILEYPLVNTIKLKDDYWGNVVIDSNYRLRQQHENIDIFKKSHICIPDNTYNELVKTLGDWVVSVIPGYTTQMLNTDYFIKMQHTPPDITFDSKYDLSKQPQEVLKKLEARFKGISDFFIKSCKQENDTIEGIVKNYVSMYHMITTRDSIHEFLLNPTTPANALFKKQPPTIPVPQSKLLMFNIEYKDDIYPIIYRPADDSLTILVASDAEESSVRKVGDLLTLLFDKSVMISNPHIGSSLYNRLLKDSDKEIKHIFMYINRLYIGLASILHKTNDADSLNLLQKLGNISNLINDISANDVNILLTIFEDVFINSVHFIKSAKIRISTVANYKLENTEYMGLSMPFKTAVSNIITNAVREHDNLPSKRIML